MEVKDKFRVVGGWFPLAKRGNKFLKIYKALSCYTTEPSFGERCELYINDQLVMYSQWNKKRYNGDGWNGYETVMLKGCPPKHYKELVRFMYRFTNDKEAREFHNNGYWKHGLGS